MNTNVHFTRTAAWWEANWRNCWNAYCAMRSSTWFDSTVEEWVAEYGEYVVRAAGGMPTNIHDEATFYAVGMRDSDQEGVPVDQADIVIDAYNVFLEMAQEEMDKLVSEGYLEVAGGGEQGRGLYRKVRP